MFAITPYDKNISIFKTSTQITNHTMNIEKIGIIKFDILGVGTLDLIRDCMQDANISSWDIDINNPVSVKDLLHSKLPARYFDRNMRNLKLIKKDLNKERERD